METMMLVITGLLLLRLLACTYRMRFTKMEITPKILNLNFWLTYAFAVSLIITYVMIGK